VAAAVSPSRTVPGAGATRSALWFSNRQRRVFVGTVTGDTSYPTGGYDIASLWTGFKTVDFASSGLTDDGTKLYRIDKTNRKLLIYTALGTEATAASNQSTAVCSVELAGF
jgi:hypothetical protein